MLCYIHVYKDTDFGQLGHWYFPDKSKDISNQGLDLTGISSNFICIVRSAHSQMPDVLSSLSILGIDSVPNVYLTLTDDSISTEITYISQKTHSVDMTSLYMDGKDIQTDTSTT